MKKVLLITAILTLLASACSLAISPQQPTATIPPSPTATFTPNPTPTPNCDFEYRSIYGFSKVHYDPKDGSDFWIISTPAKQGMNEELLEAGLEVLEKNHDLYSYIVIRNDAIVFEHYFNGSNSNQSNNIHSVSKSIMSALVGIAIREEYIESSRQRIIDFYPEYYSEDTDPLKKKLTIHHLLTMRAGLDWAENVTILPEEGDWFEFILSLPIDFPPGQLFGYNTGLTHLLSGIITRSSGMSTCEFAYKYLFSPLGITVEYWGPDPQGYFQGGNNIYMTPREMAKFGLLYLHDGVWNGEQIVPAEWISKSKIMHVELLQPRRRGYGYLWWITNLNGYTIYSAWGYGGQYIHIIPALNTVVVSTADEINTRDENIDPDGFMENYLIPSIVGE